MARECRSPSLLMTVQRLHRWINQPLGVGGLKLAIADVYHQMGVASSAKGMSSANTWILMPDRFLPNLFWAFADGQG